MATIGCNNIFQAQTLLDEVNENVENYLQGMRFLNDEQKDEQEKILNENFEKIQNLINGIENKKTKDYEKVLAYFNSMKNGFLSASKILDSDSITSQMNTEATTGNKSLKEKTMARTIPYISYLYEIMKNTKNPVEKSILYNKIAHFYHRKAKDEMKQHHLRSLLSWHFAKENYLDSLTHDPKNLLSASGYAKTLTYLGKYNSAVEFLNKYTDEEEQKQIKDFYMVGAMAHRKLLNFEEAEKLLDKHPDKELVSQEKKLLENLNKNSTKTRLQSYVEYKNEIKVENYELRQSSEKYRILSIDGGGIRGIIPAYLVCEIEKRSHLPISHSFNLLAGTSTGGIISAGLSVPLNNDGFTPKYKAYDILDIYLNQGHKIFQKNFTLFGLNLFNSTYSEKGRHDLFERYFEHKTISQSLTDLVIPAADEESLFTTYLFNRKDAREDPFRNDTYIDALMATSAAPTFFPSHNIAGKGLFNDGGVHVNNPTSVACSEALRYNVDSRNIQVLSLGTGTYVPKAIKQSSGRGLLFWATHISDVALEAQVGNTDIAVYNALGKDRYQRWQVWFENPISLDDYGEKNINFLTEGANLLIEEFDASEENYINKLVESIVSEYNVY